jgi:hypothetical protein
MLAGGVPALRVPVLVLRVLILDMRSMFRHGTPGRQRGQAYLTARYAGLWCAGTRVPSRRTTPLIGAMETNLWLPLPSR